MKTKMIVANSLTTGELMSLLAYCMNILMSLMMLSMIFVMVTLSMASARRIGEVLEEKPDLANPEKPDFVVPDGSIRFENVTLYIRFYHTLCRDVFENNVKDIIKTGESV